MYLNGISYLFGVFVALQATLFPLYSYGLILLLALLLRRWRWLSFLLAGFCWTGWSASLVLLPEFDPDWEGRTIQVEGVVADVVTQPGSRDQRFVLRTSRLNAGNGWQPFTARLRLRWYAPQRALSSGEQWQLQVRLKRPHGFANPGSFDFERWLFQQRILATGYVHEGEGNQVIGYFEPSLIERIRSRLRGYFAGSTGNRVMALLQALTIGDRTAISPAQWQVLNATGTTHLMAISGLHISLVAGLSVWLVRRVWERVLLLNRQVPAIRMAAFVAILVAYAYASLSGMGIPAQRALVMCAVAMAALIMNRRPGFFPVILLAAVATLGYDPLSVLAGGWWLSFWAVLVIAWMSVGRCGRRTSGSHWLSTHVVLALAMAPLLLVMFQQTSLIAPLANLVAVPLVGLLVVPLALLGVTLWLILPAIGDSVLQLGATLLQYFWPVLEWLGGAGFAQLNSFAPPSWTLFPAVAGLALLLVPKGLPGRWAGGIFLLPLFTVMPAAPPQGALQFTLLDVGQGLAAVVQTANHTLVYDTGPSSGPQFDTGAAVLIPFLRSRGIRRLDTLVISHGDNDHRGGAASLLADYPAGQILSSVPDRLAPQFAIPCLRGMRWEWDSVQFEVLHPEILPAGSDNNASCVLRIRAKGGGTVLLTGDIERPAERQLLVDLPRELAADVLIVPHHGSSTSSSAAFIRAVAPRYALIPAGYLNRYRFPKEPVVQRYQAAGAALLQTGTGGAITVDFPADERPASVSAYRSRRQHFWQWQE